MIKIECELSYKPNTLTGKMLNWLLKGPIQEHGIDLIAKILPENEEAKDNFEVALLLFYLHKETYIIEKWDNIDLSDGISKKMSASVIPIYPGEAEIRFFVIGQGDVEITDERGVSYSSPSELEGEGDEKNY